MQLESGFEKKCRSRAEFLRGNIASPWRLNVVKGSKTNKSNCQFWKKLTFDQSQSGFIWP
jgi:hypothetical protein